MAAVAPIATKWPRPVDWLREFLVDELAPYPGRGLLVARMVIAATLVMLLTMTFRLPFGVQAIYALVIARETHWATVRAMQTVVLILAGATGYVILGTMVSLGDPTIRTLWVIASLFIAFLAIRIIADYGAAVGFGVMVALAVPILDQHISTELKVTQTLWAAGQTMLGAVVAALVALFFAGLKPGDFLVRGIAERLASVEELLHCLASGCPIDEKTTKHLTRMVMLGTSQLRRNIQRSGYSQRYAEQMGVVVALVGRLVDLAGSLVSLNNRISDEEGTRLETLAQNVADIRVDLINGRIPSLSQVGVSSSAAETMPLLPQIERTVSLIAEAFVGSNSASAYGSLSNPVDPPQSLFIRDSLSNPEHIRFALKGCLAASLCYITYTALNWRGISTAVMTCILTALTTIGSSRQKQFLRVTGAMAGGLVIGMGSQVFILPHLDSIGGFTVLFLVVTVVAAWLATSGPRLSYFGIQLALAFYLINLQDFRIVTSLTVARDRVVGILLGLFIMWLLFDQVWSAPTAVEMRRTLTSLLRMLAQLVRQPVSSNHIEAIERSYSLRETINSTFNQVRALADAVWFEFGSSREQDLALRSRIVGWQPQLRMLFVSCVTLLKYRLQLPGFELPEPVRLAEQEFEECLAHQLNGMADRLQGNTRQGTQDLEVALARLKDSARNAALVEAQGELSANLNTFLPLSERITGLTLALGTEISS